MTPMDFDYLSGVLKRRSGVVVTPDKLYLLESRLNPVARKHGASGLAELTRLMRSQSSEALLSEVTEAMTTNESFFFRDQTPFDLFKNVVVPTLMKDPARAARKVIRVWSAACSSGQEPYSLAMLINEMRMAWGGWRFEITATDLSKEMVNRAREGVYTQFEVQRGLPVKLLLKNFSKEDSWWRIKPELGQNIRFNTFNLMDDPRRLGQFDVVFCRNVLIYFDPPTKGQVLQRISTVMPNDGHLFLGGAETILGVSDKFASVPNQRGVYRKA